MIIELAHFCLILALLFALAQSFVPALAARAARGQFALCLLAFAGLMAAFVTSDFSVLNVAQNSHTGKPLLYKISAVWGNHEGSMLLWVLLLATYGAALSLQKNISVTALRMQGALSAGFLTFILLLSNPFLRLFPVPPQGADLNPLLQDPALAFHPPILYTGYVGFSAAFSIAVAALIDRTKPDRSWARHLKPWILWAWTFLSAGIALGSWWAYYELGWGGWWFWDPVENASLMPWLISTALLHSILVMEKRGGLARWTVLLAILTFSLSMLGTFLVRSGVLTSVHSFALDPGRGIFILLLLGGFTGAALSLYAARAGSLSSALSFSPLSREGAIIINNLFLCVIAATVMTGTLYPLALQALNAAEISVGPPYFHATIIPLAVPMILLMAAAPFMPWKKSDARGLIQRLQIVMLATVIAMILTVMAQTQKPEFSALGIGLAVWLLTGTLASWRESAGGRKISWTRIKALSASQWSLTLSHAGLGIALIGMLGTGLWTQEKLVALAPSESFTLGRYELTLTGSAESSGPNYKGVSALLSVRKNGGKVFTMKPEIRHYTASGQNTTEADIRTFLRDDIYVVTGGPDKINKEKWAVHSWIHPFISWLWAGFTLIILGGIIGLTEKNRD